MRSRLAVVALVCLLIALGVFLVVCQGPQRPGTQPRTAAYREPRDEKRPHEHKPAFPSVPAHHETTDSDDLLFVSSLVKTLGDSETTADTEPDAVARISELARRAEPPADVRTEARSFTAVSDANRYLQERQFRCQIGGEDFQEGQRIVVGWMDEITLTGERTQVTFRGRRCAAVRVKGERYEMGVRPVIKLSLPSAATIYLTGFSELDKSTHRVSLDEAGEQIRVPQEEQPTWSGWVIMPALHVHVCHRVKSIESPAVFRALSVFSVKCQWPSGPVQAADQDSMILDEHFNIVVARDRTPFLCLHVGPWAFTPEPDVL